MRVLAKTLAFPRSAAGRSSLVLVLGGCNLVLVQWIMVRELTALLMGTEMVALFVTGSAFAGYSFGYLISNRLPDHAVRLLAMITLPLHLMLPVVYRLIMVVLSGMNSYRIGFVLLLALTPFTVSAFYSLFLPRFISVQGNLVRLYGIELVGSVFGVLFLFLAGGRGLLALYLPYTVILLAILALVNVSRRFVVGLAILAALWLAMLPALDATSNASVYRIVHGIPGAESLASVYSPYQKVDVLRDGDGNLYLYLNGLMDYGSGSLTRFNVILSGVPAQLIRPRQMAIVGSGSMASVGFASPYAGHVTTVELDPVVSDLGKQHFGAINHLDQVHNWTLVTDDAKHFFGSTTARYDLIVMDVPAPFTIQEATLHSAEYYALLKDHLTPDGVVSVSLSNTLSTSHMLSMRVVAGLLANFKEVLVVTSGSADLSFAYASDRLPFDSAAVEKTLRANDETQFVIYQPPAVRLLVSPARPISLDDMSLVWDMSVSRVSRLLGLR
jgi:predicted membrane-bound spermidine synthase